MPTYTCPCCGYITFESTPGSHDFCKICGWWDDSYDLQFVSDRGGVNRIPLIQAQKESPVSNWVVDINDYKKDPTWRPLNTDDFIDHDDDNSPSKDLKLNDPTQLYYWRENYWLKDWWKEEKAKASKGSK